MPVAPAGTAGCQRAIAAASRSLLKLQLGLVRGCLDRIAGGLLTGEPTTSCRGSVSGGVLTLPSDTLTHDKILRAVTKFQARVARKCSPSVLAQLDACGSTAGALATCVSARTTAATSTLTTLLYGDIAPIADKGVLACLCGGTDPNAVASCIRCTGFGQLTHLVRATYGPP